MSLECACATAVGRESTVSAPAAGRGPLLVDEADHFGLVRAAGARGHGAGSRSRASPGRWHGRSAFGGRRGRQWWLLAVGLALPVGLVVPVGLG